MYGWKVQYKEVGKGLSLKKLLQSAVHCPQKNVYF